MKIKEQMWNEPSYPVHEEDYLALDYDPDYTKWSDELNEQYYGATETAVPF